MARIIYAGEGCTGCKICSMACVHAHDLVYGLRATRIWVVREEPLTDYLVTCHQCDSLS